MDWRGGRGDRGSESDRNRRDNDRTRHQAAGLTLLLQELDVFDDHEGADDHADLGTEHGSQWDEVDQTSIERRPALDRVHVEQERRKHILEGDETGGGHRSGTSRPGKTEFPPSWADDKIMNTAVDVAAGPDVPPKLQHNGRWRALGTREEVGMVVIVTEDGAIWTAYPESGPGVIRNSLE